MYSDWTFGNTSRLKAAQCGQVAAANSVIVTAASAGPSAMSGSDTGFLTSDALCAIARSIRRSGETPPSAASPVSDSAAVNVRRVIIDGVLRSALQERLDLLVELFERCFALDHLAIDKEGRRRIDLQHFAGIFLVGGDLVHQRLILEAILDLLLAETGLLADPGQGVGGVLHHPV